MNRKPSQPLDIVERIVRNLPIRNTEYWYVETKSGRMYFALGVDSSNRFHGVWAFLRGGGVARTITFDPNQYKGGAAKALLEDGCAVLLDMEARGMLRDGYSLAH